MPVAPTYPGVYIEEIPSGVRTITGVATSITAFVGRARRGPVNTPERLNGFGDFERTFGGLWNRSTLGFAIRDFFLNGGSQALVVRLFHATIPEADEAKVEAAAKGVADAAIAAVAGAGATPDSVATAARTKADTFTTEPEKAAADAVAKAAEAAKAAAGATKESVADAAAASAKMTVVRAVARLSVGGLSLRARSPGKWGGYLRAQVDIDGIREDTAAALGLTKADLFNLTVTDDGPGGASEKFLALSAKDSRRRVDKVLDADSRLVTWDGAFSAPTVTAGADSVTTARTDLEAKAKVLADARRANKTQAEIDTAAAAVTAARQVVDTAVQAALDAVSDGGPLAYGDFNPANAQSDKTGLFALERADLFNLLCIPPYLDPGDGSLSGDVEVALVADAAAYCEKRRAMLLVDPPKAWDDAGEAAAKFSQAAPDEVGTRSRNAAIFFPRLRQPNPLQENRSEEFVPSGAVAGVFARTDTQRGVWKAPAGLDAVLVGVPELSVNLTDPENGSLNPHGLNCLRAFPVFGRVVWGARTLRGDDQMADEYKYIPVRRLALYIEESLYRGTKWVVFEPNDEPLWGQIRLNVGAFMHNLFRQGAFQGSTPKDAYFVKCDHETTTQNDINLGVVNIVVGFAPLKPAEFVIIKLQQIAGKIDV